MTNDIAEQAASAAAEGWAVFPVLITAEGHKQPLIKWKDGASSDAEAVRAMRWANANAFGVKTGLQPDGSFVVLVDLDVRDGAGGKTWFKANEERLGRTRAHGTRSGGVHLLHHVPAGVEIRNSASRLAPGVDIRGAGGYAVWPGTPGYEVKRTDPIAPCPEWLLEELLALKVKAIERSKVPLAAGEVPSLEAAEMVGDGSVYGLAALRSACAAIVGAEDGAKHETLNREAYSVGGLVASGDIRDAVAAAALDEAVGVIGPYCRDEGAARATLRQAYAEGKARPRDGVEQRAMKQAAADFAGVAGAGATDAATEAAQAKDLVGAELTADDKELLRAGVLREWVWIDEISRLGWKRMGKLSDVRQFSARHNWWGEPLSSSKSAAAFFLKHPQRQMVEGMTYFPGGPELVTEAATGLCWNRWTPSPMKPRAGATEADVAPWLDQVKRIIPDARKRGVMLDWLAFLLQKQAVKCNWAPLLVSLPGMGKDFLLRPVILGLGEHNTRTIGVHDVESGFNGWSCTARLVIFNEVHSASRVAMGERMKPHITAPPTMLERNVKHTPQWQQPNRHCMVFWSNRLDAIHIEPGDRRYFVLHITGEKQPKAEWQARWGWMNEGGGAEAVAGWLLARDISAFDHGGEAPWTEEKDEMAIHTSSDLLTACKDAIEGGDWPDLVSASDLAARLNAGGLRGREVTAKYVSQTLRTLGAMPLNSNHPVLLLEDITGGGKRTRLLSIRNHTDYQTGVPAILARKYAAGWAEISSRDFSGLIDRRPVRTDGSGEGSVR